MEQPCPLDDLSSAGPSVGAGPSFQGPAGLDEDDDDDEVQDEAQPTEAAPGAEKKQRGGHGRRKIEIEYIKDKIRRHITFSKRKAGISKKAYELSRLTGAQVLLLISSERGQIYSFATPKLQPILMNENSKGLIEQCLNDPEPLPQLALEHTVAAEAQDGFDPLESGPHMMGNEPPLAHAHLVAAASMPMQPPHAAQYEAPHEEVSQLAHQAAAPVPMV